MHRLNSQFSPFQPLIEEYYEFSPKVDELNDTGNAYDAIQSGDRPKSPMRFSKLSSWVTGFTCLLILFTFPISLTLCILETPKRVLLVTMKIQK